MISNLTIRPATAHDAEALLSIYAPHVLHTAVSFEEALPSTAQFAQRIQHTLANGYPYLVAEAGSDVVGYCYAGPFNSRRAWRYTVETSIYVKDGCHGLGVGKALVGALESALRDCGYYSCIAIIAYPRTESDPHLSRASVHFHKSVGYSKIAHLHCCGYKFGRWYDAVYMEHRLAPPAPQPAPLRRYK